MSRTGVILRLRQNPHLDRDTFGKCTRLTEAEGFVARQWIHRQRDSVVTQSTRFDA